MKIGMIQSPVTASKEANLANAEQAIARAAAEERYIKSEDIARLIAFRDNPSDESWIGRKG